ncbi:hypothetical protein Lalb_Chr02g0142941 [Lupinus albus]|uniref:Uncharacterized protein n=1 Tax=Lupinus albus TaxID=3870 RepID=A0A6A4QZ16_LUPAL|nr:hypothetical protein Lalb_Chr02g0142941 [Lupinus albus]
MATFTRKGDTRLRRLKEKDTRNDLFKSCVRSESYMKGNPSPLVCHGSYCIQHTKPDEHMEEKLLTSPRIGT